MLTQATAQDLGLKGNFSHFSLTLPSFLTNSPLWQKDKSSIINSKKAKRFQFYKYGKNLGMEVIRYLEYYNGRLFYFENANDKESKGECVIENLYFYYFSLGKNFVMHLTNGQQHSTFYFHDNNFFSTYYNQIIKYVIQIDFNERYQLLEQIGQGTFSKVYYGMNKFTNRTFAIKIMPKMDETGFSTKSLACQEKRILKFTKTDHLCGMEQFFQDNFNYIFVLQFIGGQDLSKILKQQKIMSTNENIFILKQVLKGLKELHELNIIHRDLKPHNIIIDSKQRLVKIVDFGLSLLVDSRTTLNQYMRCGTMGYIAPQIVNNQASNRKSYNCQSDMFAFGIIAHMLLQGTNPMRARTYKDTVDRNINCNFIINDKQILISYGRDCLELIKGCLNKDPQLRPTAKEALENIFFQEKQLDEKTVTNKDLNEEQVFGNKISELNYLEDKQVIGDKQISSKNFNASQICTPKKTIQTGHSMSSRSKISGFSGIM